MVLSVNRITDKEFKKYDVIDQALISTKEFVRNFGEQEDYIEAHLYDQNGNLIFSDNDVKNFSVPGAKGPNDHSLTDTIEFDPGSYVESLGFTAGTFDIEYNIFRRKIFNAVEKIFFIKEISADRTELRLSTNLISNSDIETGTLNFVYEIQSSPYFKDFLLNFGNNNLVNGVNIILDKNSNPYSILVKLYKPLPEEFDVKSSCNIVEELSESFIYRVELFPEIPVVKQPFLRPANFNIDVETESIPFSDYISINTLLSNTSLEVYRNLINKLKDPSVSINVDYTDFSDFVHFSSAKQRVNIFKQKLSLLEGYNTDIDSIKTISNYTASLSVSSSIVSLQNRIADIIERFDGYERYLYYTSASAAWPKSGSLFPYNLYPISSSEAISWIGSDDYNSVNYGGVLATASLYDQENQDNLVYSTPEYITIDDRNEAYVTFLAMMGHHFDNIWVYIKAITDIYKTQNNLAAGISKDMVFHMLKSMGVKLYNSKSNENIFDYFLGVDSSGNIYPVTSSYETLITSSRDIISGEDQYKEKLKRIYHNLSYLNKSKGTSRGIKSLITAFGIPSTILDVVQYGGSDKSSESVEFSYDRFTYALYSSGSSYVKLNWAPLTQKIIKHDYSNPVADAIEFRFKPDKLTTNYSSSILTVINSGSVAPAFGLNLNYNPVNDLPYGNLSFILSGSQGYISSSVSLPFYLTGSNNDTEWWNILLRRISPAEPCAPGWVLSTDGTYCRKVSVQDAISPSGSQEIVAAATGDMKYAASGSYIMNAGYTSLGNGTVYAHLTSSHFWFNTDGNTTDGRLNDIAIWMQGDGIQPLNEEIGFTRKITVTTTKTYYIAIAADNIYSLRINGATVFDNVENISSPAIGYNFHSLMIYPVILLAGDNYIEMVGTNLGLKGALAAEIYDNTAIEIASATSSAGLDIVFSTQDMIGQSFDIGTTVGYSCDEGWYLVSENGAYRCEKLETAITSSESNYSHYDLYVKNEIGGRIGHQASGSLIVQKFSSSSYDYSWNNYGNTSSFKHLYLGGNNLSISYPFISGSNFEGHLQELRLWSAPLSESVFNVHVLNPESIQGNDSSSAYNDLAARFPLGNNLLTYDHYLTTSLDSVHPHYLLNVFSGSFGGYGYGYDVYGDDVYAGSGSSPYTLNINTASFYNFSNKKNYDSFTEEYFTRTPNAVYANPVNKKVRIVDNSITGSVLLPILKLEESPEVELSKDIHLIDISFSPQNETNKDIIAHFGNTIDIDNLIGNPSHDFEYRYPDLDLLNEEYRKKYADILNYRDFIRIVNFFDNSLFKMIKDYTPARSNLQTGLTVKSPILERPRVKKTLVSITNENYSGSIDQISDISFESVYSSSYGDGSDFYTGELSGSSIDVNEYFEIGNTNPYKIFSETQNTDTFDHSDFNVTMNNVSASRKSTLFKKINNNNPDILEEAEIQDSYYSIQRHTRPRYDGSKSTSQLYNFYTEGDTSYGKNAAIDVNTLRFAWVNEVNERNFNFVDKSNVNIKYLIDRSGSVTELTRNNDNIFEVQNLFKSGKTTIVSLLDQMNPTNQVDLGGTKYIWQGGFSYSPIVYREINETLYFNFQVPLFETQTSLGVKAIATSSLQWTTIGNSDTDFSDIPSSNTIFEIDNVPQTSPFSFNRVSSGLWSYTAIPLNTNGPYKHSDGTMFYDSDPKIETNSYYYSMDWILPFSTATGDGGYVTSDFISSLAIETTGQQYVKFTAPRQSTYKMNLNFSFKFYGYNPDAGWSTFKILGIIEKKVGSVWNYVTNTDMKIINVPIGDSAGVGVDEIHSSIFTDHNMLGVNHYAEVNCYLSNYSITLNQGDEIRILWYLAEMRNMFQRTENIEFEVYPGDATKGYLEIYDDITSVTVPITTGSIESIPPFFYLDTDYQTLVFNNSASIFYSSSVFITPTSAASNNIDVYYSPIIYPFYFEPGDTIRFTSYFTINPDYYYVRSVTNPVLSYTGGKPTIISPLKVKLDRQLSSGSVSTQNFAFIRREPDETNVMLNYNKREGKTSSGLLIPYNLDPEIKEKTADIIGPLKEKILSKVLIIN